jgi:5-methylcytosine-specific restriction enzyme A
MALPPELKPEAKTNIIDLVAEAGIDVSDWSNYKNGAKNPGANPKYCYEWALIEPGRVAVCNLWYSSMKEVNGSIEQHLVLRDTASKKEADPTRRARRERMATVLSDAAAASLPVRVIVLDGKPRVASPDGKTHVKFRTLDPMPWSVVRADRNTSEYVVRRGTHAPQFVDQFELRPPADVPVTLTSTTTTTRSRSREVRMFVLRRAAGKCEFCGATGFKLPDGRIYLETHHVHQLALGGSDSVKNVAALCANHHREAHHGKDAELIKTTLQHRLLGDA